MRGASLRLKINLAILLAFIAAAVAFGGVLTLYMADRQAASQNRTRTLLAVLATHRLEALTPLLDKGETLAAAHDILSRLARVEGVTEAALFDATGALLSVAGPGKMPPAPLQDAATPLPTSRQFTVSASDANGNLAATLVEPIRSADRNLGFLRLRYSLRELNALNERIWVIFAMAVVGAYIFLAGLLNLLLHRFVLQPVATLRVALEAVEAGNLDHQVPVLSNDALGRLAAAFNAMAARLKTASQSLVESRAEIEEHRRLLARRVEERTAELAQTNVRLVGEIEARTQAEARLSRLLALYKAILESTAEAVVCVATSTEHEILACNRRFLELWSLPEDWPQIQSPAARLQPILDKLAVPDTVQADLSALLRDSSSLTSRVLELADGRCLERRSGPIRQDDQAIGRVFSFVDITERRTSEESLRQARAEAEKASKAKGTFLAVMSHEIRTPLNAIMGLTDELLAGEATAQQREHLDAVKESATHLLGVVNDILDFSKIEAGKLVLERIDFDVRDVIGEVARAMGPQARQKGLGFGVEVDAAVPAILRGDPGRLRQVLLNLLGNAVKFTQRGAVSLHILLADPKTTPPGRIGLSARVTDTGIGIDPKRLPELFESFNQGPGSITRRFGGTGLGLVISKQIVERMGGDIQVQSRENEGSTFSFTVSMLPGNAAKLAGQPSSDNTDSDSYTPLRVLLVEDNALNAAVTRLHLGRMGHQLTVASSAREGYAHLAKEPYDAVLMDVEMPDIDGITASRTIRAGGAPGRPVLAPNVPIVAVTAHAVEDVRQQCLDAGMNGFITKPINYHALQNTLESLYKAQNSGIAPLPAPPQPAQPTEGLPALFDPASAREAMGISWPQFQGLITVSIAEGDRRLTEVEAALAAEDPKLAHIAAHTFKGAAATLGAFSCRQQALALEQAIRDNDLPTCRTIHAQLVTGWQQVRQAVTEWEKREEEERGAAPDPAGGDDLPQTPA